MLRVLITGSSGQIGTNLGLALLKRGDQVCGHRPPAQHLDRQIPTRLLDLSQAGPTDLADGPVDVVVHLAAYAKVFELVEHPDRAFDNIRMMYPALEYCRQREVPVIFGPAARSTATSSTTSPTRPPPISSSPRAPIPPARSPARP